VEFKGLEHSLSGVALPLEVQELLRFVGRLVGRALPKLYGLRKRFIHLEGASRPLFPYSKRAAAVEIWVVHAFLRVHVPFRRRINLLEQTRESTDRKREVLRIRVVKVNR
jgi:hypothetical protein